MLARPRAARQTGFTLIELIIVIVVMSILAFGTVQFILNSTEAYSDSARRTRVGSVARVAIEQLSREIRSALPNSVRAGASAGDACIEFVPVLAGSNYLSIPTMAASTGFSSVPFFYPPGAGRVAVYPRSVGDIYSLSAESVVSAPVTTASAALVSSSAVTVNFASAHRFPAQSPGRRWFMVAEPVSFCLSGDKLFRYTDYGFVASQPFPGGALPAGVSAGRRLLATHVRTEGSAFAAVPATLQRSAMVQFDLTFAEQGEGIRISHEVQLPNVP